MLTIIYHSKSGNTKFIAKIIANAIREETGLEVKSMPIENIDYDFLNKSKAVIIGFPTYNASYSWEVKQWIDNLKDVSLSGKIGAVFATENYLGGGADFAELSFIGSMLVKGMLIYSAGASEGKPYTHYGCVCIKDGDEEQKERARIFGVRIANKAKELFC